MWGCVDAEPSLSKLRAAAVNIGLKPHVRGRKFAHIRQIPDGGV